MSAPIDMPNPMSGKPRPPSGVYNEDMDNVRVVYSSDGGRQHSCPTCGRRPDACRCARPVPKAAAGKRPALPDDGIVRVWRDGKRRRGKTVTVIAGVEPARRDEVAGTLKRLCGSGGTVQDDGTVEIQGDHRERVAAKLGALGYRVKLAGG
jgi:translation initiation factor 1